MDCRIRATHSDRGALFQVTIESPSFLGMHEASRCFEYGPGGQYPDAMAACEAAEIYADGAYRAARIMTKGHADSGGHALLKLRMTARDIDAKAAAEAAGKGGRA